MEKIAFILYLGGMIFGVLFFGAIHPWVYTLVFLAVIVASLLLIRGDLIKATPPMQTHPHPQANGRPAAGKRGDGGTGASPLLFLRWVKSDLSPLFFCFLAFLCLQMIPLPQGLLLLISPESKISGDMSLPAASVLGGASAAPPRPAASLRPGPSAPPHKRRSGRSPSP